jgi:hypothetical protein
MRSRGRPGITATQTMGVCAKESNSENEGEPWARDDVTSSPLSSCCPHPTSLPLHISRSRPHALRCLRSCLEFAPALLCRGCIQAGRAATRASSLTLACVQKSSSGSSRPKESSVQGQQVACVFCQQNAAVTHLFFSSSVQRLSLPARLAQVTLIL